MLPREFVVADLKILDDVIAIKEMYVRGVIIQISGFWRDQTSQALDLHHLALAGINPSHRST